MPFNPRNVAYKGSDVTPSKYLGRSSNAALYSFRTYLPASFPNLSFAFIETSPRGSVPSAPILEYEPTRAPFGNSSNKNLLAPGIASL